MKKTTKFISLLFLSVGLLINTSCETTDLDKTEDPNGLPLSATNPDLILSGVQVAFATNIQNLGTSAAEVSRLEYMFGRNYQNAYGATFFNTEWSGSYRNVLKNIQVMNTIATERDLKKHLAMGQVFEAFTIVSLVDTFGDIPYSEALDINNLTPKLDSGAEVYAAALVLLDQAIANFNATSTVVPSVDFYYNKNWTKWARLANTIKLKIYIQTRLVDATALANFNQIISSGNYIQTGDDFQFAWGVSNTNPDSRHPKFILNYTPSGVEAGYQANWLLDVMRNEKSVQDPRMRYYFYRQVNDVPVSEQDLRCSVEPAPPHYVTGGYTYCIIDNNDGYWGRDHGNDEGIPNDRAKRTAAGVYPAGGRFDGNNFVAIGGAAALNFGGKGNGITPILLSSTVDFWRAEAALVGGTGNAKALMLDGIQKSFTKVRAFVSKDPTANLSFVPPLSNDVTYLADVSAIYDAAASSNDKLNVVIKEFFITLYGNGIDAYNAYRRTGFPRDVQANIEPNPGAFIRSFLYPASETNTTPNVPQKVVSQKVFWDNNPETGFPVGN